MRTPRWIDRIVQRIRRRAHIATPGDDPNAGGERLMLLLLVAAAASAIGVPVVYALDRLPSTTQLLGLFLGVSLLSAGAALIVAGRTVFDDEPAEGDYPVPAHPDDERDVVRTVTEGGHRITRRRMVTIAAGGAAGAVGVALLTPLASLGPVLDSSIFARTPWRAGRRLVDAGSAPILAEDIIEGTFYTAFPEAAEREDIAAPLVLVRLPAERFDLPAELRDYPADGIVAFSKICTHAGCAVSLYRSPTYPPASPAPALVCPCHYSTFDPGRGGAVEFGPAGRPLPMLPLEIDADGHLRAAGDFNSGVGPSWTGIRRAGSDQ